jgi:hypothetical protein
LLDEYTETGQCSRNTIDALKQPLGIELAQFQHAYTQTVISAKDIILPPFLLEEVTNDEKSNEQLDLAIDDESPANAQNKPLLAKQKSTGSEATEQLNLISDSYFSSPNFVKRLCDLSDSLIEFMADRSKQMDFLMAELKTINKRLPAAVYLPFVNDSIRNYVVLHIVADEAKIFRTKERCPLMLLMECYRPNELALEKVPEILSVHGKPIGM